MFVAASAFDDTKNVTAVATFECPEKDAVSPCKCFTWQSDENENDTEVEIACRTRDLDEHVLSDLFVKLNQYSDKTNYIKAYESLRLENTGIKRVSKNIFGDVSFKQLDFFNNLDLVEFELEQAFNNSRETLHTLCIQGSDLTNSSNIFSELAKFEKLETVILSNTMLLGLPDRMFEGSNMTDLTYLDLSSNNISSVGRRVFAQLPEIHRLNLDNNQLTYIYNDTFDFDHEESKLLLIFLRFNQLNSSSFEPGLFQKVEKTVFLYLNHNNLTHLPEEVFRPVLEIKGDLFIAMWNNPYECDCRSKWLLNNVEYYKKRVHGIKCGDKRDIWEYTFEELHCELTKEI